MRRASLLAVLATVLLSFTPGHVSLSAAVDSGQTQQAPDELRKQAEQLAAAGKFAEAAPIADRAAAAYEGLNGAADPGLADYLMLAGTIRLRVQDYRAADTIFQRELALRQRATPPDDSAIITALTNLATAKRFTSQIEQAEDLIRQVVALYERAGNKLGVAGNLSNLANLQLARGDVASARSNLARARSVYDAENASSTRNYASLLTTQATIERAAGNLTQARDLGEASLALREQLKAPQAEINSSLSGLATTYQELGQLDRAEPLLQRLLDAYDAPSAPQPISAATTSINLAMLKLLKGNLTEAEPLYAHALALRERMLGPGAPEVGAALERIAVFNQVAGKPAEALANMQRSTNIIEQNLRTILLTGSEQQRLNYMTTVQENLDIALSMRQAVLGQNADAAAWAANLVLRRKGRVLEAVTTTMDRLAGRVSAADRQLLEQLKQARGDLSKLVLQSTNVAPAERARQTADLQRKIDDLESTAARQSREIGRELSAVELSAVQAVLPADTVLIEFVRYRPFDPKAVGNTNRFSAPRYALFALHHTGAPVWTELGAADAIDREVANLRKALRSPTSDPRAAGHALTALVIDPAEAQIGAAKRLVVASDSELSVIPFAALADARGRYLVERFEIVALASGRDLLRLTDHLPARDPAVIVAAPAFGSAAAGAPAGTSLVFPPLPGTAEEATALGQLLKGSRTLVGAAATEHALKGVAGPRILHIASHGFFLNPRAIAVPSADTRSVTLTPATTSPTSAGQLALVQSGLALAGANARQGGDGEDGLLSAVEAASLDLRGTELVVLSACETGLGEVRSGDGVYGLRRALAVAGAETQVMSLWQVNDAATRDLMIDFYKRLAARDGRAAALRDAQLRFLKSPNYSHPYYWAAFVVAGDWTPLRTQ